MINYHFIIAFLVYLLHHVRAIGVRPPNVRFTQAASFGDRLLRNPITGIIGCCARAVSGDAVAEPTIPLMKSRRRIASSQGIGSAPTIAYSDAITAGIPIGGME